MSDTNKTIDAFSKSKWNWRAPSVDRASVERSVCNANNWTSGHMYRTSYHDMSDKVRIRLIIWLRDCLCINEWVNHLLSILKQLHSTFIFIIYRNQFHLSNTQSQSMLDSFQERRATQNWVDHTLKSQEDVSVKKMVSKLLITDSKAQGKYLRFYSLNKLILISFYYYFGLIPCTYILFCNLVSWLTRKPLIKQDQHSSEDTEKKPLFVLIQHFMKNGARHSERLTWSQIIELSQMLSKNFPLRNVNLIIHLNRLIEWALLLVDSKPTHNSLMKLHGKLKQILIQTSSELNTEIDIIKQSHSINQL